jgi:hypothetical protein
MIAIPWAAPGVMSPSAAQALLQPGENDTAAVYCEKTIRRKTIEELDG